MSRILLAVALATALVFPATAIAKKPAHKGHHYAKASGKTCKKEFMFMKKGKCEDSRKKKTA